jgi:hypothetical protein
LFRSCSSRAMARLIAPINDRRFVTPGGGSPEVVRKSAQKNVRRQITTLRHAKRAFGDDPGVRHGLEGHEDARTAGLGLPVLAFQRACAATGNAGSIP